MDSEQISSSNANQMNCDLGTQHYATQLGSYDEMYASRGKVQPYWENFMASLEKMGGEELARRRQEAQRILRDNGVTYNVYADSKTQARPWQLDPVPLLISSEEWDKIAAGLVQRAELFNLILQDVYGEQNLLKKRLVPIELIYGHEGFLRPCVGSLKASHQKLFIYSADLARGPDGRMWALGNRTQAPSGAGYALENRIVMTRVLPDLFRDAHVHRLSGFFRSLRSGLANLAAHNKDFPRIVVLTPGSLNETYFEHAYLSSHLGYTLVQGDDLTVRDGRVWLKSLQGLHQVDVILRRVDDSFCDPLELRSSSRLGVAGILEAVRRGNVTIANPLGSSVLENNGLLAFLPRLARYFLNQELLLPSVATWWCGQKRECDFVLQNLDRMVIKAVNRSAMKRTVFGSQLSRQEKENLRAMILAKPHLFVGQEKVGFSTVPAFVDGHIEPRNAILRNFVIAGDNGYEAMPGGLTRIAKERDTFVVSNQEGGLSKDTWVLADKPEHEVSLWLKPRRNQLVEPVFEPLPSRAADNLYWVGRNLERSESAARLMRTVLQNILENLDTTDVNIKCRHVLLKALTQVTVTYPGFIRGDESVLNKPEAELLSLARDQNRIGALPYSLNAFRHSAFNIRDLWSLDTWRCVDDIQQRWQLHVISQPISIESLLDHLNELITGIVAFTGLTSESMARESGWLMLDSGRRLERALMLIALLRSTVVLRHEEAVQNRLLEAVLISTDSLSVYQRRYRSFIKLPMVLELLLMDETHPRSLAYQLQQLGSNITAMPSERHTGKLSPQERDIFKAYTDIRLVNLVELTKVKQNEGVYSQLDSLLVSVTERLWRASDMIAQAYFSHAQDIHQLTPTQSEEEL